MTTKTEKGTHIEYVFSSDPQHDMGFDPPLVALIQLVFWSRAFQDGLVLEDFTDVVLQGTAIPVVLAEGAESDCPLINGSS